MGVKQVPLLCKRSQKIVWCRGVATASLRTKGFAIGRRLALIKN